jgi:hypothetical protein
MIKNRFTRLILKRVWLIAGVAALAAVIVFFLVRNKPESFTARATICICPVSGNLFPVGAEDDLMDARFGNLRALLKSRETLEQVSICLLAANLLQNMPGSDLNQSESHYRLLSEVPPEILDMVAKSGREEPPARDSLAGAEPVPPAAATSVPVIYTIRAGDNPAAVCSRFNITPAQLEAMNVPMPPFQGGRQLIVGITSDELNANDQTVTVRKLAADSLAVGDGNPLSTADDSIDNRYRTLVRYLTEYRAGGRENYLAGLLSSDAPFYGIRSLSAIKMAKLKDSDMIGLSFTSDDPAASEETLRILLEVLGARLSAFRPDDGTGSCRILVTEAPSCYAGPVAVNAAGLGVLAFFAVLILIIALLFLVDVFDRRIKTPARFERFSGLELLGTLPVIPEGKENDHDLSVLASRSVDFISRRLFVESFQAENAAEQPFIILIISSERMQGKTRVAGLLTQKLRASGSRVIFIKPSENLPAVELARQFTSFDVYRKTWDHEYTVPDNMVGIRTVNELLRNFSFTPTACRFLIIELPALQVAQFPVLLARSANLSLVVASAAAKWSGSDSEALRLYQTAVQHPVMGLLNYCEADFII